MCVAAPGRVVEIKDNIAKVSFSGNIVTANAGLVKINVGDNVLVHAGLIIQKVSQNEAEEMQDIFEMLRELGNE